MTPESEEITNLDTPIDAMYLIHKALCVEAAEAERMVRGLHIGESLQPFRSLFNQWASALGYHAIMEDEFMTPLLPDFPQVRANQESHRQLEHLLEKVELCMDEEIGRTRIIARTQRHLYGAVVSLHISQDDHLEEEEAFILPLIREHLSEEQQIMIVKKILIDEEGDRRWILTWLGKHLDRNEQTLLEDAALL